MIALLSFKLALFAAIVGPGPAPHPSNPYEGPPVAPPINPVDRVVFNRLQTLGIPPANLCSDSVFVRRAYLDVIGTLPTAPEVRAFLANQAPAKRALLVDRLLARPEFADFWAMKWSDLLRVKAEFPVNLWPVGAQEYHRWIWTAIRDNLPYDQFARTMLTSNGSNFRVGAVNFYRSTQTKEPAAIARAVALTFMGTRAEKWPADRLAGMAAFFSQLGFKSTGEWKEEIVYFDPYKKPVPGARPAVFPDGTAARIAPGQDPRQVFADWLVNPKNPWFTAAIANRVWSWLLGRGIVQEPDDLRPDNPPSNPELLALLSRQLIADHYNMKPFFRLILNSQTYQLSSIPRSRDPAVAANFASYPLRRLDAEVLIDAINQITGTTEQYTSAIPEPFTFIPPQRRAIALPDGSIDSTFLETFGRSARDTGFESERNNAITANQRLQLLNSTQIQRKIYQGPKLMAMLTRSGSPAQVVDNLYLTILSRTPTKEESAAIIGYALEHPGGRLVALDLAWSMVNSAEFLYRH